MIHIDNLTKFYPRQQTAALVDVTLHIPRGSIFGLLGPNGAGKTTLISILVGLQKRTSGEIRFDGKPLEQNLDQVRAITGFVPQDLAFYPMLSVAENLNFYTAAFGVAKTEQKDRVERAVSAARLEQHFNKPAHALSGGLKRRLNLAIGLLNNPQVLFLDEPTVGIDPQSRHFILETIARLNRDSGMTIIYTSHYMEEVQQICDHIGIIDAGKILLSGDLQELLNAEQQTSVRFRLRQPVESKLSTEMRQRYQAHSTDNINFELPVSATGHSLYDLLAFLQEQGMELDGIRYGYQSLEELYMRQTMSAPRE